MKNLEVLKKILLERQEAVVNILDKTEISRFVYDDLDIKQDTNFSDIVTLLLYYKARTEYLEQAFLYGITDIKQVQESLSETAFSEDDLDDFLNFDQADLTAIENGELPFDIDDVDFGVPLEEDLDLTIDDLFDTDDTEVKEFDENVNVDDLFDFDFDSDDSDDDISKLL